MELKQFEHAMGEKQVSAKLSACLPSTSNHDSLQEQQQQDSHNAIKKGIAEIADTISEVYLAR